MPLGIYISVPFCRTKCTFCNFASDVFSRAIFTSYVDRVCSDIQNAPKFAADLRGHFDPEVDSIYLGGGTPTVLEAAQLERLFAAVRSQFAVSARAEITIECAPGTLTDAMLHSLLECGVNRVSLGVQSFVDQEAAAVGRIHKQATVLEDIARLRSAGIYNIGIDLIAGLPHQTAESWEFSLAETIRSGALHVSVYMLEVDDESRLGSELLAGGTRYHAHFVPDEEAVADFYVTACEKLQSAGIAQYEISNFAREGFSSRHNFKYWTRQPYLGFGVDAHSMLLSQPCHFDRSRSDSDIAVEEPASLRPESLVAVRFSSADSLEQYMRGTSPPPTPISRRAALEESFFLGLRLTEGISLSNLSKIFGDKALAYARTASADLLNDGLIDLHNDRIALTPRGRLLSNEVFERFLVTDKMFV